MPGQSRELWELTDHVCRACFGRIVLSADAGPGRRYRCTNCGLEAIGRDPACVCACGLRLKNGKDAGLRCERNGAPTPEFPSEVVACQQ